MGSGHERLERRAEDWLDRKAGELADRPRRFALRVAAWVVLGVLACVIVVGVLGWLGAWGGEARRVTGPMNVREQHTVIIGDWQAMQAAAANACAAKTGENGEGDPTLVESPDFAYAAQYRRVAADYNRRQANLFEGKLVGPAGYPRVAPKLADMQAMVCG